MDSLRSCRFKSKSKVKSIDNVFAALILLKSKTSRVARRHSLKNIFSNSKRAKTVFQRGNKRIFFVSLVDTRLVNPLCVKRKTKRTECERHNDRSLTFLLDYSFFLIGFLTTREMNAGFVLNMGLFCSDLRFKAF